MSHLSSPEPERRRFRHPLEAPPPPDPDEQERRARAEALRQGNLIRVELPGRPQPYLTYLLLAVNAAIFLIRYVDAALAEQLLLAGMIDPYSIIQHHEWYRLLTGMFLHGSEAHILMNGLSLYSMGLNVETLFGHRRFTIIYFLGGLMGSALHLLLGGNIPAVGASGAIFALVGAEIIYLRRNRRLYGRSVRQQYQNLVIMAGINLAAGFFAVGIAFWGHAGGFIGGLALAWFIGPRYVPPATIPEGTMAIIVQDANPLEKRYAMVALYCIVLFILLLMAAVFLSPEPFYFVP